MEKSNHDKIRLPLFTSFIKCGIRNFHARRRRAVDVKEILYVPKSVMP